MLAELQGYELINKKHTLDNFIVLCYNSIDAERLIYLLEEKEICVATGAACAASKGQKSHVLTAIGLSDAEIAGSLRLKDLPGMKCPWAEDLADAKRVAVRLGIDFEVWDFEDAYREKVVDYMLEEFRKGNTPNPDVMCNQEIKFKLFYEKAIERGADFIATGHYARIIDGKLARAVDENKDQTYFLYRISEEALAHTIFPIGDMLKPDVKKLAKENNLHNAYKKESMGVCFVGEVGMKDFLKEYINIKPGEIREIESKKVLGYHEGAVFYTIGQRHGLYLNGVAGEVNDGLPYYVVAKDLDKNIVYVSKNLKTCV